jgi:hypothetical protein
MRWTCNRENTFGWAKLHRKGLYERRLIRQSECKWLSKSSGTPVRVDLWCIARPLHIHPYFVGGHCRMLGTRGNGWFETGRPNDFALYSTQTGLHRRLNISGVGTSVLRVRSTKSREAGERSGQDQGRRQTADGGQPICGANGNQILVLEVSRVSRIRRRSGRTREVTSVAARWPLRIAFCDDRRIDGLFKGRRNVIIRNPGGRSTCGAPRKHEERSCG